MATPLGMMVVDFVRPAIIDNGGILRRPIVREAKNVEEPPTLVIAGDSLTVLDYSLSTSQTLTIIYKKPKVVELRRVFDELKIKNKDDESQFVEVEYLREVELGKPNQKASKKSGRKHNYEEMPPAENYEKTKSNVKREAE